MDLLNEDNFETSDDEVQLLERESDNEDDASSEDGVEAVSEVPEVVRPLEQRRTQRRPASDGAGDRRGAPHGVGGGSLSGSGSRGSRLLRTLRKSGRGVFVGGPIGRLVEDLCDTAAGAASAHAPACQGGDCIEIALNLFCWSQSLFAFLVLFF